MSAEETAIERIEKKLDRFETVKEKVNRIDTALYGTGNPHGGLFERFAVLEGKVSTLSTEIKGVEKTLIAKIDGLDTKIDGVEKNFDKMFNFAKWTIVVVAVPIFIEVVLPMIRRWTGG